MMQFLVVLTTNHVLRQERRSLTGQREHNNIIKKGRWGTSGPPAAWNAVSRINSGAHPADVCNTNVEMCRCFFVSSYMLTVHECVRSNRAGRSHVVQERREGMHVLYVCMIGRSVHRPRCIVGGNTREKCRLTVGLVWDLCIHGTAGLSPFTKYN